MMNLLPKSHQDFSQKEYWNTFFKKRGKKAFEWYGEYPELCGHLHKYIKTKDEILMIGCGNSTLSADLYDVGHRQISNIDISRVVVEQMLNANKERRPDMEFVHMDALNMTFEDGRFSVVLDKGTLDALMPDGSEEVCERIDKFFNEISRVLRLGGRYVCISLLQEHIIKKLVNYFANKDWMFRVVRCHEAEQKTRESGEGTVMPVFAVIATKFKQLPQLIIETCMGGEKILRLSSAQEVVSVVKSAQDAALVTNGLNNSSLVGLEEVYLDLFKADESSPRYTVHILDQNSARGNGKFAAFIVPQGRESDWIFSTPDGRKQLLKSANHDRLAIVSLHRNQVYKDLNAVKEELAEYIKSLAPKGLMGQIPFLSLGSDIGKREMIHRGFSELSGDFVVEEVDTGDGNILRRLIFLKNQFVVQSESRIKSVKSKNGKTTKIVVDPGYLACDHHVYMTVGTQLALQELPKKKSGHVAVIGLGGGGLCTFLHKCFTQLNITAVDIDPAILSVAQQFFGLTCDDRMKVIIDDGIRFIDESQKKGDKFDAVLFDVDSKDTNVGMSCPPTQFIEKKVLENVKKLIGEKGFFILNLVCRDASMRNNVTITLKGMFKSVASYKMEEDVNEIMFCTNKNISNWSDKMKTASEAVNSTSIKNKLQTTGMVDVSTLLESLNIDI